ncbi:uncharacterized protein V1516DRAFT_680418 [Lipomyces oligophaga]|uniref:uncharacterized protein n=1 Tax=Lipomyces oligophaga TaxID=45792 RepID=UPI0034CD5B50
MKERRDTNYERPDFDKLAELYPPLRKFVVGRHVDFSNHDALRTLTQALFKVNFDLSVELPSSRLCPRIPNRLSYLSWIDDLLPSPNEGEIWGLDVGTGASCVYPLLGCRIHSNWNFIATDIDSESICVAGRNVDINGLRERIFLSQAGDSTICLPPRPHVLAFLICNPPFYESLASLQDSSSFKRSPAHSTTLAREAELVTPGGETQFVCRIVDDSLSLIGHAQTVSTWYSSMLGKRSSLEVIIKHIHNRAAQHGLPTDNYAVTQLVQGGFTVRWAIAWRWDLERIYVKQDGFPIWLQKLAPPSNRIEISLSGYADDLLSLVSQKLRDKSTEITCLSTPTELIVFSSKGNVWSRAYRRKRKRDQNIQRSEFKAKVNFKPPICTILWLCGFEHRDFVSFVTMIQSFLRDLSN